MTAPSDESIFEMAAGTARTDARRTILLSRRDVADLMAPADYLAAVESGFRTLHSGHAEMPPPMHIHATGGGFHGKGAAIGDGQRLVALKLNGNFPGNPARGLPTIQGVILLCDGGNGTVLALLDSIEITIRRTAAATALAARHLAKADAKTLTLIGCGAQARAQAEALCDVRRFERGFTVDLDRERAVATAADLSRALGVRFEATASLREATRASGVIVTCTTAKVPFLGPDDVAPGTFIAAVGADNPEKSEIAPALMARARVVVDSLDQCLAMGDLHHAIAAGAMTRGDVHAELGDLVAGTRPGRSGDEIAIFDSTGTAIQDVASAGAVYKRALTNGCGTRFSFA
ncbi:MAG: ornithine cyclodeaminase family protein [Alphaproteobacteria bacterium]|nr:ornithine cyclodeaminase family protein [Alphaproteobacteria bacterium]